MIELSIIQFSQTFSFVSLINMKSKSSSKRSKLSSVSTPVEEHTQSPEVPIYHMDELAYMLDDDVYGLHAFLNSQRSQALSDHHRDEYFIHDLETELAYVQREIQLRNDRWKTHGEWMKQFADVDHDGEFEKTTVDVTVN